MPPTMPKHTDTPQIIAALEDGKTIQWCADQFGWPRGRIAALINGKRGWLIDAERDTALIFQDGRATAAAAAPSQPQPVSDQLIEPKATAMTPAHINDQPASELKSLLRRGDESESAGTRSAAKRARTAVEDLRQRIQTEDVEKHVRDRIATLQKQMAAAQEELRKIRPAKTTTRRQGTSASTAPSLSFKDVRAWAASHGIPCSTTGRIPQTVIEQYKDAHGLPTETAPAGA